MNEKSVRSQMSEKSCPTLRQLRKLFDGEYEESEIGKISGHIETCMACRNTLIEFDQTAAPPPKTRATGKLVTTEDEQWREVSQRLVDSITSQWKSNSLPPGSEAVLKARQVDAPRVPMIAGYQVNGMLGRGGMGAVYGARHEKLKRDVAIKILPESFVGDDESAIRFAREMEAIGQLDHPNIVKAYDAGEQDGQSFLVLERIIGETVSTIADQNHPLPVAHACEIIRQAACGLAHAHSKGLIHRDVKPSNMMINHEGVVKLLDLGLARLSALDGDRESDLTATGRIMGTVDYMSPEQAAGRGDVDEATDIYSLGASLYRLLVGHCVFYGPEYRSTFEKLNAIVHHEPAPLSSLRKDMPPELCHLVSKMIAKEASKRISSSVEVEQALAAFCDDADLSELIQDRNEHRMSDQESIKDTRSRLSASAMTETLDGVESDVAFSFDRAGSQDSKVPASADQQFSENSLQNRRFRWRPAIFLTVGLALVGLIGMTASGVFEIHTEHGTLLIKSDSDDFITSLKGKVVTLKNLGNGQQHHITLASDELEHELEPGSYVILKTASGIETKTNHFRLRSGGEQQIEVWWKAAVTDVVVNRNSNTLALPGKNEAEISPQPAPLQATSGLRKIAESILSRGGTLLLSPSNKIVESEADLPDSNDWQIHEVLLEGKELTDDVLQPVAELKSPIRLVLHDTSVTDAEISSLRESSVNTIAFIQPIHEPTLEKIAFLEQLEGLDLDSPICTAHRPIATLKSLKNLKAISLSGFQLTPKDIAELLDFEQLVHLYVGQCGIGDESLHSIASISSLRSLSLDGNRVTDRGLKQLANSKKLENILLNESSVTAEGIATLKREMGQDVTITVSR